MCAEWFTGAETVSFAGTKAVQTVVEMALTGKLEWQKESLWALGNYAENGWACCHS